MLLPVLGLLAPPPVTAGEARAVPVVKGVLPMPGGALLGVNGKGDGEGRAALVVRRSRDGGRTWTDLALAARGRGDLGDGNLVRLGGRGLALVYRDNAPPSYAIRVVRSPDEGRTWDPPETLATSEVSGQGLWAPFLLPLRSGDLLAFYDDEATPVRIGRSHHQWISFRRYDRRARVWGPPAVACRKPGEGLARDGMFVAVETSPGRIVGAVEDVAERDPRPSGIYRALSTDDGRTWAWERGDHPAIFAPGPGDPAWPHMAVSPALADLGGGRVLCAFATDAGLPKASRSGTPPERMPLETWGVLSRDAGVTWGAAFPLHSGTRRDYLPFLTPRPQGRPSAAWLTVVDFDRGSLLLPLNLVR